MAVELKMMIDLLDVGSPVGTLDVVIAPVFLCPNQLVSLVVLINS